MGPAGKLECQGPGGRVAGPRGAMEGRRGLRRRGGAGSGLFLSWEGRPKEGGCGCHLLHPSPSPTSKKPWPTKSLSQGPPPRFFHFFPAWGPTLGQVAMVSHLDHCRATSLDPRCQPGPLHPVLHTQLKCKSHHILLLLKPAKGCLSHLEEIPGPRSLLDWPSQPLGLHLQSFPAWHPAPATQTSCQALEGCQLFPTRGW